MFEQFSLQMKFRLSSQQTKALLPLKQTRCSAGLRGGTWGRTLAGEGRSTRVSEDESYSTYLLRTYLPGVGPVFLIPVITDLRRDEHVLLQTGFSPPQTCAEAALR